MSNIFKRTHMCGTLNLSNAGQEVVLNGWVAKRRNLGGLIFVDLRDKTGIVQVTFDDFRKTQDHKAAVLSTANALGLSRSSVTSYLPYKKGVYFPCTAPTDKISVGAERQRRYRAMKRCRSATTEEGSADVRITARSK